VPFVCTVTEPCAVLTVAREARAGCTAARHTRHAHARAQVVRQDVTPPAVYPLALYGTWYVPSFVALGVIVSFTVALAVWPLPSLHLVVKLSVPLYPAVGV